jgi:hypothetical protein
VLALPVNILVLPFVPVAMALGFLSGVAGLLWGVLGKIIGVTAFAVSTYQINLIGFASALSFSAIEVSVGFWTVVAIYAIMAGAGIYLYHHLGRKLDDFV